MKKYLYIALAAAALTSCSSDDTLDVVEKEAIAFSEGFINNSTRAIDLSKTNSNLKEFNVWGTVKGSTNSTVAIFANDKVEGTAVGAGNIWSCTTKTQYWIAGATYNFAALVNADGNNVTLNNGLPASVKFTYDQNADKDLLYAKSEENIPGQASDNEPVAFTFDHMLSKVGFKVNNTNSGNTGYSYKVKDIKITTALSKEETVTITQNNGDNVYTWSENASSKVENLAFGSAVAQTETSATAEAISIGDGATAYSLYEHLIIPQTCSTLAVSFTLETYVTDADGKVQHVNTETINKSTAAAVTFAPETYYLVNIGLSVGNVINFAVTTVNGWGDANVGITVQ